MAEVLSQNYQSKLTILEAAKEYEHLREKVEAEKILHRSYLYYTIVAIGILIALSILGYLFMNVQNPFILVILAIALGFSLAQIGGYLHDAGHRALFKTILMNDIAGNISATLLAVNFNAWRLKHNLHHVAPNQHDKDPDVSIPLFTFSKKKFEMNKGIIKKIARYQAFLFYPMTCLLTYSMQFITNISYFIKVFKTKLKLWHVIELILFLIPISIWYILPFVFWGWAKALIFVTIVPMTMGFYLSNIFAPNHKGMPELEKETKISFLEQQIITSRNVKGHWFTDFVYFGLNYQIEHHLFPDCPRNKLKLLTPHIKEICDRVGFDFIVLSVIQSNKTILSELHKTAHGI